MSGWTPRERLPAPVVRAMADLSYRPNAMARGLASRRSRVLGVVSFDTILYGPASTLLGIERAARAVGYGVSIVTWSRSTGGGPQRRGRPRRAGRRRVIFAPQMAAAAALHSLPGGMTVVAVEAGRDSGLPYGSEVG